jgi:hypothetical protein
VRHSRQHRSHSAIRDTLPQFLICRSFWIWHDVRNPGRINRRRAIFWKNVMVAYPQSFENAGHTITMGSISWPRSLGLRQGIYDIRQSGFDRGNIVKVSSPGSSGIARSHHDFQPSHPRSQWHFATIIIPISRLHHSHMILIPGNLNDLVSF